MHLHQENVHPSEVRGVNIPGAGRISDPGEPQARNADPPYQMCAVHREVLLRSGDGLLDRLRQPVPRAEPPEVGGHRPSHGDSGQKNGPWHGICLL